MYQEEVNPPSESFDADRPIKSSREDRFGRSKFAKRVAHIIAERRDSTSIVVGVYAPWGEGKTSVLNRDLKKSEI
jgi:predicted KAP-like P-loop ATPase